MLDWIIIIVVVVVVFSLLLSLSLLRSFWSSFLWSSFPLQHSMFLAELNRSQDSSEDDRKAMTVFQRVQSQKSIIQRHREAARMRLFNSKAEGNFIPERRQPLRLSPTTTTSSSENHKTVVRPPPNSNNNNNNNINNNNNKTDNNVANDSNDKKTFSIRNYDLPENTADSQQSESKTKEEDPDHPNYNKNDDDKHNKKNNMKSDDPRPTPNDDAKPDSTNHVNVNDANISVDANTKIDINHGEIHTKPTNNGLDTNAITNIGGGNLSGQSDLNSETEKRSTKVKRDPSKETLVKAGSGKLRKESVGEVGSVHITKSGSTRVKKDSSGELLEKAKSSTTSLPRLKKDKKDSIPESGTETEAVKDEIIHAETKKSPQVHRRAVVDEMSESSGRKVSHSSSLPNMKRSRSKPLKGTSRESTATTATANNKSKTDGGGQLTEITEGGKGSPRFSLKTSSSSSYSPEEMLEVI